MNERWRFPWGPFLAGAALLLLSLATVEIRAGVVQEGQDLMRLEHRRVALKRHVRDLRLDLQEAWNGMDTRERPRAGRTGS